MRLEDELLHFSEQPVRHVHDTAQVARAEMKPRGFWVSVGSAWPEWCAIESFGLSRFAHVTRVRLASDARILRLETIADVVRFTREYDVEEVPRYDRGWRLEWRRVAEEWDGILMPIYHHTLRFDAETSWYYSVDVASGCIWNARAIASVDCVPLGGVQDALSLASEVA